MGFIDKFQDWAAQEIADVTGAPVAVALVFLLGGVTGWWTAGQFYAERFATQALSPKKTLR